MGEVRQRFAQGGRGGVIHDRLLKNVIVLVGALCIILGGSTASFAASNDPSQRTSLDIGGPGGVNIPDGFFIQIPFNGPRNVNSGYSPTGGSPLHKGKNDPCCRNDYYALDFDLRFEPVLAVASGMVVYAGPAGGSNDCKKSLKGYGRLVIIDHGNHFQSNYAHLSQVQVAPGQWVNQGDQIAISGNSGCKAGRVRDGAVGAHLHFAMYKDAIINGDGVTSFGGPHGGNSALPEPFSGYYGIWQNNCLSRQLPSLCINGRDSATTPRRGTDSFVGSGYTEGGIVQRKIILPDGTLITASTRTADAFGNVKWKFTPDCTTPLGTYILWAVDQTTGGVSNTVVEVITRGKCKQSQATTPSGFPNLQTKIFDLVGHLMFQGEDISTNSIRSNLNGRGRPLPTGVYLAVITTRREDGTIIKSEVKRLVILH